MDLNLLYYFLFEIQVYPKHFKLYCKQTSILSKKVSQPNKLKLCAFHSIPPHPLTPPHINKNFPKTTLKLNKKTKRFQLMLSYSPKKNAERKLQKCFQKYKHSQNTVFKNVFFKRVRQEHMRAAF